MNCPKCGLPVYINFDHNGNHIGWSHEGIHYGVAIGNCVLKRERFMGCVKRIGENLTRLIKLPFQPW